MKTCILAALNDGEIGQIRELSFVADDHQFGPAADGKSIHIEGRGELTVSRGKQYQDSPAQPLTINGYPASQLKVYADGVLAYPVKMRRRDPAEAAERIRAGYEAAGIPAEIAEVMIEAAVDDPSR